MISPVAIILVILAYLATLALIARWGERRASGGRPASGHLIHGLALTVYCTSWTFYGSIGSAANGGILFLTIYFGPTLCALIWWFVLRRLVRIRERHRVTSISDLIASRYGRSRGLGALVTIIAMVGIVPYIALQLKAVNGSFDLLAASSDGGVNAAISEHFGLIMVGIVSLLTIVYGVRKLDATERHPGMVAVVVAESVVKLVAFVAAGLFVVFGLFDGPGALFEAATAAGSVVEETWTAPSFVTWTTFTILAGSAILFLPRQFHVSVVESSGEKSIHRGQWILPLYLLLINLFVLPIAWGGLLLGHPASGADFFLLKLPIDAARIDLSLLVFIGGLSAALGMITVSAMTMATMITNTLVLPVADRFDRLAWVRRRILQARWIVVVAFVVAGHLFYVQLGESYMLLSMGMMSFAAVLQFMPPIVIGLVWAGGNRVGAATGLIAGFGAWMYTLLLPAMARSGWIGDGWIEQGLFGLEALRPYALLGIEGLDALTHAVLVSMTLNVGGLIVGSLAARTGAAERRLAREHVDILGSALLAGRIELSERTVVLAARRERAEQVVARYLGIEVARDIVGAAVDREAVDGAQTISLDALGRILDELERRLSGAIGPAAAHHAVWSTGILDDGEQLELARTLEEGVAQLDLTPQELWHRINDYEDREALLARHNGELERTVDERTADLRSAVEQLSQARDAAEAGAEAKANFLANMSHELRTPMTAIVGFTDLLAGEAGASLSPAERDEMLESIKRNGTHLLTVIDDVLDLSKIDAGCMSIERAGAELEVILKDIAGLLEPTAQAKDVRIEVEFDSALDGPWLTDPNRLRQIVLNLVGNAVKFTEDGEVRITAGLDASGERISIAVADTGIGMTAEQAAGVFGRFQQADESMTRRFGGTGLGLSISLKLAELLGGSIDVTSAPGEGSTFTVTLPAERAAGATESDSSGGLPEAGETPASSGVVPASPADPAKPLAGLRILLVEDGPDNRRLVSFHLKRAGAEVTLAEDGIEGVEAYRAAAGDDRLPHVILMDMQMPRLDGYGATGELKKLGCPAPIIALTAHAMAGDRERCLEAGCDDYLTKPIDAATLVASCRTHADAAAEGRREAG